MSLGSQTAHIFRVCILSFSINSDEIFNTKKNGFIFLYSFLLPHTYGKALSSIINKGLQELMELSNTC